MNILIVHNFYKIPGGEDTVVRNEIKLLEDNGHNVYTYFVKNEDINTKGIFNKLSLFKKTVYNKKIKIQVQELIYKNKIEIVHCHNTFPLISPSIYKYAKECGCKVFQTIHNFRLLCPSADFVRNGEICEDCLKKGLKCSLKHKCYHNSFLQTLSCFYLQKNFRKKKLYKYVDKFICLTEFNKEKLSNIIPKEKIVVKPNFSFFNKKHDFNYECSQFLYIGRIENIKGIDTLINVFDKTNYKLVLCGTGTEYEKYKVQNNRDNIIFKGFCSPKQIQEELKKSYALIVPSKWYEGFPMNIAEAMSMGIPVIARNIGNLPYIIENGVNGLLFDDEIDLIDKLDFMMNCENRNRLVDGAIKCVEDFYSPASNYKRLIDIYEGK